MKLIASLMAALALAASVSVPAKAAGCSLDYGAKAFFECLERNGD